MAPKKHSFSSLLVALICITTNVQAVQQESIFLQTDRSVYVSGETVFFKLFVLDAASGKCSNLSKVGYIELRAPKSAPVLKLRVSVSEGIALGSFVLPDSLHSSVYQFVAFTAFMKNWGEDRFFHREILVANRLDNQLKINMIASSDKNSCQPSDSLLWIKTDKTEYAPGEKINIRLGSVFSKANLSVSVFEKPQPSFMETNLDEVYRQVSAPSNVQPLRYMPEKQSKILRGWVKDATTNQTIPDAVVLLSCPDSVPNLQYAISDSAGIFHLQLTPYYDGKELFLSIKDVPYEQNWKLEVQDSYELANPWKPVLTEAKDVYKAYLKKSQEIAYIQKSYMPRSARLDNKQASSKPFCPMLYRRPVKPIYPADFVALDSFPEISVEILPTIKLYKKNGNYHAYALTRQQQTFERNDASIFLDGVYIDDINKIIGLNSERIKKIEVIENKRAFGNIFFFGIISIQTYANEVLRTTVGPQSLRLSNDSLTVGKPFIVQSPPSTKESNMPFFKQLLYWNPTASLHTDYTFYSSQNTGNYLIKAEGIADDGTPISVTTQIQVNNPQPKTVR